MISHLPFWRMEYVVPNPRVMEGGIGVYRIVYSEGDAVWVMPRSKCFLTLAAEKGIDAAMNRALHLLRLS